MTPPEQYLNRAIELSRYGMQHNHGGPFGAVVVKDGKVVGEGYNQVTGTNDPTAHAEVVAIRQACAQLSTFDLHGAEIYCSCEPCPMCLAAIYWARIGKIYYANTRHDAAAIGFDDDFIYREVPKHVTLRSIPATQLLHAPALQVFNEWKSKTDKTNY